MKKIALLIVLFLAVATPVHAQSFTCKTDSSNSDICNLKPGQENACPGISTQQMRLLCFSANCLASTNDEVSLNCPGTGTSQTQSPDTIDNKPKTSPSPLPATNNPKDCDAVQGSCIQLSAACNGSFVLTAQCQAGSNANYTQMCCKPKTSTTTTSNPSASTPYAFTNPATIDPGGYSSLGQASCQGKGLADYMNAVLDGVKGGNLTNIKVLSPAFNLTSSTFSGIYLSMQQNGARFSELDGIAGNVYNIAGRTITSWLAEKIVGEVANKPLYITEAGSYDGIQGFGRAEMVSRMGSEIDKLKSMSNIGATLLFNAFNSNGQFEFTAWSDPELKSFCQTGCDKIGVSWGTPFRRSDSDYSRIPGYGMKWSLEIANANNIQAALTSISYLHSIGVTTIIRLGSGTDSGGFSDPKTYVEFLKQVNALGFPVYAIAGPNEPDVESWATPTCQNAAGRGPLEAHFGPLDYHCDAVTNPEYHPLRPYPGSPCDPLIPRSMPEAPLDPNLKYNTFACGTSLTPEKPQVFDPYGDNSRYEKLDKVDGYSHTICLPRTAEEIRKGSMVTCYRTSKFNVTVDLSHANLGILGNTQDPNLTDEQKVNEYLSWYLTGTPQIGGLEPINPDSQADIKKLIDFSGPLRKLLPQQMLTALRTTVASVNGQSIPDGDVHNTILTNTLAGITGNRLSRITPFQDSIVKGFLRGATFGSLGNIIDDKIMQQLLQNVPFSSMEDTAGEVVLSVFKDPAHNQQEPNLVNGYTGPNSSGVSGSTAPIKLLIQSATQAVKK